MATTKLSRSGTTGAFGKNSQRLDILVSEEVENALVAMAALRGIPKSEMARHIIERSLFGEFTLVQRMHGGGS